jgi:uncharacterized membrane protein
MNRRLTVAQWAVVLAMCVYSAAIWPSVPQSIPVHWSTNGADQSWDKPAGLLLLPARAVVVLVVLTPLPRIGPNRARYPEFANARSVATLLAVAGLGALHIVLLAFVLGGP